MGVKCTIEDCTLECYPESARGTVTYYVSMDDGGPVTNATPQILADAMSKVPQIGDSKDFTIVPGAPNDPSSSVGTPGNIGLTGHVMRVRCVRSRIPTNNSQKLFIDIIYESRPRPYLEFGCAGNAVKTSTYLSQADGYKQMVLNYKAPKGSLSSGTGLPDFPPADTQLLATPTSGTRMQFGSTVRLTNTLYNTEITQSMVRALQGWYATCTNRDRLFFTDPSFNGVFDDTLKWLCSSISCVSADGGWTYKLTGEWVFSPFGWDSIDIYTLPFTGQPAIVAQSDLNAVYATPQVGKVFRYPPVIANGVGRFPQQECRDMQPMVGLLSGGIIFPSPQLSTLIPPT